MGDFMKSYVFFIGVFVVDVTNRYNNTRKLSRLSKPSFGISNDLRANSTVKILLTERVLSF